MDDDRDAISVLFKDWEQIHPLPFQSSSSSSIEAREQPPSMGWEVVLRRETVHATDDYSIFPPSNHEGLHISFHDGQRQGRQEIANEEESESEVEALTSPSDDTDVEGSTSGPFESRLRVTGDVLKQLRFGFEFLCSKIFRIASSVRSRFIGRGTIWSFVSATGVGAAVLFSLMYMGVRWWRRRSQIEKLERLILLVREQDEKISRLSQQIAQMNEVFTAHHRVSVLRKG